MKRMWKSRDAVKVKWSLRPDTCYNDKKSTRVSRHQQTQHEAKCNFSPPASLSSGFFRSGLSHWTVSRENTGNTLEIKAFDFISRYGLYYFTIFDINWITYASVENGAFRWLTRQNSMLRPEL